MIDTSGNFEACKAVVLSKGRKATTKIKGMVMWLKV